MNVFPRLRLAAAAARAAYRQAAAPPPSAPPVTDAAPGLVTGLVTADGSVKGSEVLDAVAALPVSTWRYLWEPETVRHLGPMAQDWYAAFGLGGSDQRIDVVDGLGVSLVCVQALQRSLAQVREEVDACRALLREAAPPPPAEGGDTDARGRGAAAGTRGSP